MGAHALLKNEFTEDEKYHISCDGSFITQPSILKVIRYFLLYRVRSPFVHVTELFTGK